MMKLKDTDLGTRVAVSQTELRPLEQAVVKLLDDPVKTSRDIVNRLLPKTVDLTLNFWSSLFDTVRIQ